MPLKSLIISHLISGGIITNYHCTSQCGHCLYRCSPTRQKDFISEDIARESLQTIRNLNGRSIHIGGGEPFLSPDGVISVLKAAKETGIQVEYVETNSSWYKDADSAYRILDQLRHAGLSTLLVSISPFHNEYTPFFKVIGVMEACDRIGISVFPWISGFISDIRTFDIKTTHSLEEYDFRPSRSKYALKCEICDEVHRFLVIDLGIHSKELQPMGYYVTN